MPLHSVTNATAQLGGTEKPATQGAEREVAFKQASGQKTAANARAARPYARGAQGIAQALTHGVTSQAVHVANLPISTVSQRQVAEKIARDVVYSQDSTPEAVQAALNKFGASQRSAFYEKHDGSVDEDVLHQAAAMWQQLNRDALVALGRSGSKI